MIEAYFGMKCNPFKKEFEQKNKFEFTDFIEMQARLNYLIKTKGIRFVHRQFRFWKNLCNSIFY